MNTLNKKITAQFFQNENSREEFIKHWKTNSNSASTFNLLFVAIILGKDYAKGFTPITNKNKLNNGQLPYQSLYKNYFSLLSSLNSTSWLKHYGYDKFLVCNINEILIELLPENVDINNGLQSTYRD